MPFVKGQSGNPNGRPKALGEWRKSPEAKRLRQLAYDALEEAVVPASGADWKDRIAAAKELLDRTEGRATQPISGEDGGPIQIQAIDLLQILERMTPK